MKRFSLGNDDGTINLIHYIRMHEEVLTPATLQFY